MSDPTRGRSGTATVVRWVLIGVLTVAGLATGIAGSFVHRSARPAGLVLALVAAVGLLLVARTVARSRWGLAVVGLAWLVPATILSAGTAAGDVIIVGDPVGLTFLFGGAIAVSVCIGLGVSQPRSESWETVPEQGQVG